MNPQKGPQLPVGPGGQGGQPSTFRQGRWRLLMWLLLVIGLAYWVPTLFGAGEPETAAISYSAFRHQLEHGNVRSVDVKGQQLTGALIEPATLEHQTNETQTGTESGTGAGAEPEPGAETQSQTYDHFVTFLPSFGDDQLMHLLDENNVVVNASPPDSSGCMSAMTMSLLPTILIFGLLFVFMRRMATGGQSIMSIGKSRAKLYDKRMEETHFDDVAGCASAKQELAEIVEFLRNPRRFQTLGGEVPKGVLMLGPPGIGKTLLARAVAGEANVPFFSITGSDFMEMFVGVGASRVRNLFEQAKKVSPSIIFIDEIDSIGRRRGAGLGGGHDEREQTLNQLLSELDGFESSTSVIVIAATNRPDILDPALLRPGRFDRHIVVNLPSAKDRLEILEIHSRDKPMADDVNLEELANGTPGLSGAELANILNEAALIAARNDKHAIEQVDIEEARDKTLMGLERKGLVLGEKELKLLAYHEAGHALLAVELPDTDPLHKVTIIPRGRAMGVTQQMPEHDTYIHEKEHMLERIVIMMGGRAAEKLVFQTATTGAENDLKEATSLARKMVLEWGMSDEIGPMASGGERQHVFLGEEIAHQRSYSEQTAREIDQEVKRILNDAFGRATSTLEEHRETLDAIAELLLEKEEVSGAEVLALAHHAEPSVGTGGR